MRKTQAQLSKLAQDSGVAPAVANLASNYQEGISAVARSGIEGATKGSVTESISRMGETGVEVASQLGQSVSNTTSNLVEKLPKSEKEARSAFLGAFGGWGDWLQMKFREWRNSRKFSSSRGGLIGGGSAGLIASSHGSTAASGPHSSGGGRSRLGR